MTKKKPPREKTQSGSYGPAAEMAAQAREAVSPADVAPGRAEEPPRMVGPRYSSEMFRTPEEEGGQDDLARFKATDTTAVACAAGGLVWVLDELWAGRAKKLAEELHQTPERFLESLLRRAWTSAPLRVRGGA